MKTVAFALLALFLIFYGLAAVSNISVALMHAITGLSALAAGVLFVIVIARKEQ
jgi:hypothetical protein